MLTLKEQTMLGNIPSDWESKPLKDLLRQHYPGDWGDDRGPYMVKTLRSTNLTNNGRLDLSDIAIRALPQRKAELLEPAQNDILLERSGGGPGQPVGRIGFIETDMPGHIFSNFLHLLRPNSDEINPRFLAWVLYQINRTGRIIRLEQQTTQLRNLHFRDYLTMLLPIPLRDEQTAIVTLLDAIDATLENSRVSVERADALSRGLMQAAFEFRNSSGPTKDTEAGRIPRSWDAIKGKQAFIVVTGGCSSVDAIRRPRDGEIPDSWFMKVDDFNSFENIRSITRTKIGFKLGDNPDFKVMPLETIIIAKRGAAILKNRVRTTSVPVALDPNLMAIQTLPGMRPAFLKYQLKWRKLSRYCEDSGVPQLNNKDLYPRYFLRAPDDQQEHIIAMLDAAEAKQEALRAKYEALIVLKDCLMRDLLTGRMRVNKLKLRRPV